MVVENDIVEKALYNKLFSKITDREHKVSSTETLIHKLQYHADKPKYGGIIKMLIKKKFDTND